MSLDGMILEVKKGTVMEVIRSIQKIFLRVGRSAITYSVSVQGDRKGLARDQDRYAQFKPVFVNDHV